MTESPTQNSTPPPLQIPVAYGFAFMGRLSNSQGGYYMMLFLGRKEVFNSIKCLPDFYSSSPVYFSASLGGKQVGSTTVRSKTG